MKIRGGEEETGCEIGVEEIQRPDVGSDLARHNEPEAVLRRHSDLKLRLLIRREIIPNSIWSLYLGSSLSFF